MNTTATRRPAGWVALLVLGAVVSGCYHFHVEVPERVPATVSTKERVAVKYWGLVQDKVTTTNCLSNAIDEVVVHTNFGYQLLAVLTLGAYVPVEVEWRCSKEPSPGGTL